MINSLPFFLWVKSGNISRKFLTFILKIFDKNFERLHYAEAMSQGLPVIYTRGQGFDRQFPDGTVGYAVSDRDSAELAEKILLAMEHYTERSNRCTELAGIFDWDRIANEILKTYRE